MNADVHNRVLVFQLYVIDALTLLAVLLFSDITRHSSGSSVQCWPHQVTNKNFRSIR